jgi:SM-20-related protein
MFKVLDEKVLCGAQAGHEPYDHLFCENVVASGCREPLLRDLPQISGTGSHPLDRLKFGSRFVDLLDDLLGPAFRQLMEEKFALDLLSCSTVASVRGWSGEADGNIHTDVRRKVLTLLLYLTPHWASPDGSLRLLRSPRMDDYALEIQPLFGNLLVFRRSESSWHGHTRYYGERIVLQINWMRPRSRMELVREKLAGLVKIPWTYFLEPSLQRGRSGPPRMSIGR